MGLSNIIIKWWWWWKIFLYCYKLVTFSLNGYILHVVWKRDLWRLVFPQFPPLLFSCFVLFDLPQISKKKKIFSFHYQIITKNLNLNLYLYISLFLLFCFSYRNIHKIIYRPFYKSVVKEIFIKFMIIFPGIKTLKDSYYIIIAILNLSTLPVIYQ